MPRKSKVESNGSQTSSKASKHDKSKAEASGKPDLMSKLMGKAKKTDDKPAAKKSKKPVIALEGKEAEVMDTFAAADSIMKIAKSSAEAAKGSVQEIIRNHYLRLCIENGFRVENPAVSTPNSKLNFQVKQYSKLRRSPAPNGELLSVADQLRQLDFDEEVVSAVQEKAIKEKPQFGMKKFTDLVAGTAAEQAVAQKIMGLIDEHLTEDEQALVLEQSIETTIDDGWQDLAVQLALKAGGGDVDSGVAALSKLYSVLPPQFVMAQIAYSGELSRALTHLQTEPVPAITEKTLTSANGRYKAVCKGSEVTLFLVKPDTHEEESLGTKKCENPNHAEMSARKWFREPEALAEQLAAFKAAK